MTKNQIIRKVFKTAFVMFFLLTMYTLLNINQEYSNILRTNLEIEDITNLNTDKVYLLDSNGYLVKVDVFLDSKTQEEKIKKILEYLTINKNQKPNNLKGYLKENIKLLDYKIENKNIKLNFSKEFLSLKEENLVITGIAYSLLELNDIENISFLVENKPLEKYTNITKEIGINNEYFITNTKNINKIVLYYIDNSNNYYVPITKYLNDKREKVEIIIDELKNTKKNLISFINNSVKLLNYREESNVLYLNFSDELVDKNKEVTEKVLNTIAYSIFDSYEIDTVIFEINNKRLKIIQKSTD